MPKSYYRTQITQNTQSFADFLINNTYGLRDSALCLRILRSLLRTFDTSPFYFSSTASCYCIVRKGICNVSSEDVRVPAFVWIFGPGMRGL